MKIAIAFSGGGSRGAYQIGVWRALNKYNIKADIVTGTSTGAITASLYTFGGYREAFKVYQNLSIKNVFDKDHLGIRLEPINLKQLIINNIPLDKVKESPIDLGIVITSVPDFKEINVLKKDMNNENYSDYIIASCSIPVIFKNASIDGKKYIDGGARKPVPYELAKKMGADKVIIVNTSLFGKSYRKTTKNYFMIKPSKRLPNPVKFKQEDSVKLMKLGYEDTKALIKDIRAYLKSKN